MNIKYQGNFISLVEKDGWEYITTKDAVAALVVNLSNETFLMVEQNRPPMGGMFREIVAGQIDENDGSIIDAVAREILEETGYEVNVNPEWLNYIGKFPSSPGQTTENIYLFIAYVYDWQKIDSGGGLQDEGENIRIGEYKLSKEMVENLDPFMLLNFLNTDMKSALAIFAHFHNLKIGA